MDIKPIKTEADYDAALAEINRLWGAESDTPDGDKLSILIDLVEVYENRNWPINPPDPVEAILFEMDQRGLTRKDLEPLIGPRSRISEFFNRKRELTLDAIRKLNRELGIPLESLIKPSKKKKAA